MTPTRDEGEPLSELDRKLDDARAELGLTWREVAERSGLSVSGLRLIRNGEITPRRMTYRALERTLGLPPYAIPKWLGMRGPFEPDPESETHLNLGRMHPLGLLHDTPAGPGFLIHIPVENIAGRSADELRAAVAQVTQYAEFVFSQRQGEV